MNIRPLYPHAALLLEDQNRKYIAVADLHIGLEGELESKGITIKSCLVDDMVSEIQGLIDSQNADYIILLGDIKHTIGAIRRQEWDDIPAFFKQISAKAEVFLVPGNHDGNIRQLVPSSINMVSTRGMILGDILLMHGHTIPSDVRSYVRQVVMGHIHPIFLKRGSVINGKRVWIYLQVKKEAIFSEEGLLDVIIVPSFNPYLYATGQRTYHKSISPIMMKIMQDTNIIQKCIVATLDGSIVGDAAILSHIL